MKTTIQIQSYFHDYKEFLKDNPNILGITLFWIKSSIALIVTCFLAFEFETPEAAWAVICAAILVHPDSGAVLSKSVARIIGTIVGGFVAVILFYLFPQAPWVFMFSMGIWVALCSFYSAYTRDFKTYAVALSGFMPAIIFMTAIENNSIEEVVRIASLRTCTISLGIICVAMVFGLTHVRCGYKKFIKNVYDLRKFSSDILLLKLNNQSNINVIREYANYCENLKRNLKYASIEDPEVTVRAKSSVSLTNDIFCAAIDLNNYLDISIKENWLNQKDIDSFSNFVKIIGLPVGQASEKLEDYLSNPKIENIGLKRRSMLLAKFIIYMQKEFSDKPICMIPRKTGVFVDKLLTMKMVLGSFLVTMISSAIWILSEWPMGPFFVTFSISSFLLQSTKDNYGKEGFYFFLGAVLSFIPAFIAQQVFMPITYGFIWFSFWLAIAILPATILKYSKKYATVGIGCFLFTVILIFPANTMNYDFQNFLNTYLASISACGLGAVVISLSMPWNPKNKIKRLIKIGKGTVAELPFIHDTKGNIGEKLDVEQDRYELLVRFYKQNLIEKNEIIDRQFLTVISLIRLFEVDNSQISIYAKKNPELINELANLWVQIGTIGENEIRSLVYTLDKLINSNTAHYQELTFLKETCKKLLLEELDFVK